ncbi:MAG TPA: DinB family protein [Chryseosolibacter sp.]
MKSITSFLIVVALITMNFTTPDKTLTKAERQAATKILEETKADIIKKVTGLSAAQLNFKATPESWSVAECVEHIAISESNIFAFCQTSLKEPADPSKRSEVKFTDEAVVQMITDRSSKIKASEAFVPSGKFGTFEGSLMAFKQKRDDHINYVKTTTDDLRNHYVDLPFGKLDAYQIILFMAAHSKRHTDQIDEILSNANFPKK